MAPRPMDLELILTPGLGNATYLIGAGGEAVVVDPPRDAWRITAAAERRGWRITHVARDARPQRLPVGRARAARRGRGRDRRAGPRAVRLPPSTDATTATTLEVGGLRLVARATPGHTPEHLAWEISTETRPRPSPIATGGQPAGRQRRPDRPAGRILDRGADARPVPHAPVARRRCPTRSWCCRPTARAASARPGRPTRGRTSTIGQERARNPLLAIDDEAAFREALLRGLGPYPDLLRGDGPDQSRRAGRGRAPAGAADDRPRRAPHRRRRGRARRRRPAPHRVREGPHPGLAQHRADRLLRVVRRLVRAVRGAGRAGPARAARRGGRRGGRPALPHRLRPASSACSRAAWTPGRPPVARSTRIR